MDKLQSERLEHFPNVNSLLKISLGLVLFTIISSALVYAETLSVDIEGNSFDIDYTATGMTVSGIEPDLTFFSLILTVDVTDSTGILNITFERSFLDSTFEGADDDFLIINQFGEEVNFTETETTSQSRTLSIEVLAGTTDIEIIGTIFGDSTEETMMEETMEEETMEEETMEEETMEEETMEETTETVDETPKIQCGPGTILKNGACELDERCGPGTVLKDGACVLDSTPKSSETSVNIISRELITGVVVALGIAGAIGIILGIMSKVSKSKN
ncbi:MAG: hypothetical protein QQN53_02980 [Nitrosopumilus sp.]